MHKLGTLTALVLATSCTSAAQAPRQTSANAPAPSASSAPAAPNSMLEHQVNQRYVDAPHFNRPWGVNPRFDHLRIRDIAEVIYRDIRLNIFACIQEEEPLQQEYCHESIWRDEYDTVLNAFGIPLTFRQQIIDLAFEAAAQN